MDSVKFPDGYSSNLRNCVDRGEGKFSGMKSHDCHVVMQRILPFAFDGLLPQKVHEAIAGIGAFFRDISARSLSAEEIRNLDEKIPVILCNLEKIFPPSFFDVMEHLPIHLPREVELGGPVQYRWMYPFERYMYHLKKKVKNLARVEGSIIAQSINEERSNLAGYYFPPQTQTKSGKQKRHDDGGVHACYPVYVPELFRQVGRLSGKGKRRRLSEVEHANVHMYILTNCEDLVPYEEIYMAQKRFEHSEATDDELNEVKEREFAEWLKLYVYGRQREGELIPTWLEEVVNGPQYIVVSHPMYCTRGYAFKIFREGNSRSTANHGVSAVAGDLVYYGVLHEILEVHYSGMLDLRCVTLYCDWYSPVAGHGVRTDEFGVTTIHSRRRLQKYYPFILGSQANQVSYMTYPRPHSRQDPWIVVTEINPRGRVHGSSSEVDPPLQATTVGHLGEVDVSLQVDLVVDLTEDADFVVHEESEEEVGEFEEGSDSATEDSTESE